MPFTIADADPDAPEALLCLRAYYDLLLDKIAGLSPDMLTLPLADAAKYRAPEGAFLIAWDDQTPVGCISVRPLDAAAAEAKRLWVAPRARGQGLARQLMRAIESRAREMGYREIKLDTNSALTPAIALYRATGWQDCAPYTSFPANIWMTKRL